VAELEVATGLPIEVLNQISKKEEKKDEAI
jgi:hypothetical protein